MFEFHGWANIRLPEEEEAQSNSVTEPGKVIKIGSREDQAIKLVRAALNDVHDEFSTFDVQRTSNGMIVFYTHGLRNHTYQPVIQMFEWIASTLPDS
jgi:hypothetical protein